MHHNKAHRKLGRTHTHRMATLRALSTALFDRERIRTTLMKAKELRPFAEKLITRSKRDDIHARRLIMQHIQDRRVARKLFEKLSPRYLDRPGGYLRILKLGRRPGDGAEMALVELLGSEPVFSKKDEPKKKGAASRPKKEKEKAAAADEKKAAKGGRAKTRGKAGAKKRTSAGSSRKKTS